MSKRKPLMPGDRVRCHREDGNPCPGHVVVSAHFYGYRAFTTFSGYRAFTTVKVYPLRCGLTGPGEQRAKRFTRLPKRGTR